MIQRDAMEWGEIRELKVQQRHFLSTLELTTAVVNVSKENLLQVEKRGIEFKSSQTQLEM